MTRELKPKLAPPPISVHIPPVRLTVHGKHFLLEGKPCFLRTVTYGPFAQTSPHSPEIDFPKIKSRGFNSIRVYGLPDQTLLDCASKNNLLVIATHAWGHGCDFYHQSPQIFKQALSDLENWLQANHHHPALGAILVGNEIPTDIARWISPTKTRQAIDHLILASKKIAPQLPVGYANFPTTEYLEPQLADFTAFNIYLQDAESLRRYLPKLHHLAGDRPVYLTEFGLDTQRNSESQQADLLTQGLQISRHAGLAGATLYAWSDHWFNNNAIVHDWSFGLVRRDGSEKPALSQISTLKLPIPIPETPPKFSVIICTRNGEKRLPACLESCRQIQYPNFEIIVINDGSNDNTESFLDSQSNIQAHHLPPSGLSAARNFGASKASGEILAYTDDDCQPDPLWLSWLAITYDQTNHSAIGGPNIPPAPDSLSLALTTAAPGAPTHVMLDDTTAEHLPGCNLSVKKSAFDHINGFDPIFQTAGDDVDFCWRLRDAGHTLGFSGPAFVWHHRRATPAKYLKQQRGYGYAEALLFKKHPQRFDQSGIRWEGFIYRGDAMAIQTGDFIYSGPLGNAPYQSLQPITPRLHKHLHQPYNTPFNRFLLQTLTRLQQFVRSRTRRKHGAPAKKNHKTTIKKTLSWQTRFTLAHPEQQGRHELYQHLIQLGWQPSSSPHFDLQLHDTQLIAATEQTSSRDGHTFVGIHGPNLDLEETLLSLGFQIISKK